MHLVFWLTYLLTYLLRVGWSLGVRVDVFDVARILLVGRHRVVDQLDGALRNRVDDRRNDEHRALRLRFVIRVRSKEDAEHRNVGEARKSGDVVSLCGGLDARENERLTELQRDLC